MERIDEATLAEALLEAPGWARVGLCAPTAWMRQEAACELARTILDRTKARQPAAGQEQLPL